VILVSTGTIAAIVVAVVVIAAVVIMLMAAARRRRLQQRFGPEYDRLVGEHDSKLKAEAEMSERERRVRKLDIRPLTPAARAGYADRWAGIQEQFVDEPAEAVSSAHVLVVAVMTDRGYPVERHEQVLADLSVEHANTLDHYRQAEEVSERAAVGTVSTEDLRLAMIHYRTLFREMLGEPGDAASAPAEVGQAPHRAADDVRASEPVAADADLAGPSETTPGGEPVAADDDLADFSETTPGGEPADGGQAETGDGRPAVPVQRTPRS
jgi:hypothetical protein